MDESVVGEVGGSSSKAGRSRQSGAPIAFRAAATLAGAALLAAAFFLSAAPHPANGLLITNAGAQEPPTGYSRSQVLRTNLGTVTIYHGEPTVYALQRPPAGRGPAAPQSLAAPLPMRAQRSAPLLDGTVVAATFVIDYRSSNPAVVRVKPRVGFDEAFVYVVASSGSASVLVSALNGAASVPITIQPLPVFESMTEAEARRALGEPDRVEPFAVTWPTTTIRNGIYYAPPQRQSVAVQQWFYRRWPNLIVSFHHQQLFSVYTQGWGVY